MGRLSRGSRLLGTVGDDGWPWMDKRPMWRSKLLDSAERDYTVLPAGPVYQGFGASINRRDRGMKQRNSSAATSSQTATGSSCLIAGGVGEAEAEPKIHLFT